MSDSRKPGRGNPPEHSQFKPGQSGNPRGRPRKPPRAEIPSQLGKDFRNVGRLETTIRTPAGEKRVTLTEAWIFRVWMEAIAGKQWANRVLMQILPEAYLGNMLRNPFLENFDRMMKRYTIGEEDAFLHRMAKKIAKDSERG